MPDPTYDPEERFSVWPLSGEEALKKALGSEDEDDEVSEESEGEGSEA
jgi:hypothetical protein